MRNRVAWIVAGLCCSVLAGCGSLSAVSAPSAKRVDNARRVGRSTASQVCPQMAREQGMIAFAARRQLKLVDLTTCRTRVLANINATDVRFSADGRWLAYSRQIGYPGTAYTPSAGLFVVAVHGGRVRSPIGRGIIAWSWAPKRDLLYAITSSGALVSASPTGRRRVITAHVGSGLAGFTALAISHDGQRAVVDRSRCGTSAVSELSTVDLGTGARTVVLRQPKEPVILAGLSPDGRWLLYWPDELCSASLAADGMPLEAVRSTGGKPVRAARHMLLYPDYLTWCGRRLIAAAGSSRETQLGSRLIRSGPPAWRQRTIDPVRARSWVSPSCAPSGRVLTAAAGRNNAPVGFGHQHRSVWLLRSDGHPIRRLTNPPVSDLSDEAPRFSGDGRWILFVRTRVVTVGRSAISKDTIELVRADGTGSAAPIVDFTSSDFSYYDHFAWNDEIAWYQPTARHANPTQPPAPPAVTVHPVLAGNGVSSALFGQGDAHVHGIIERLLGERGSRYHRSGHDECGVDHATKWWDQWTPSGEPALSAYFRDGRFVGYQYGDLNEYHGPREVAHGPVLATARGLRIGDSLAHGQKLYGRQFHFSTAQGGSWTARTATGRIDGYAFGNPDARPTMSVPVETIDAGDVGCPALSP